MDQPKNWIFRVKLISELPPLAPVASTEDLTSSELENNDQVVGKGKGSLEAVSLISKEEYALDFCSPPVLYRLPNHFKDRAKRREPVRRPSSRFIAEWRNRLKNK